MAILKNATKDQLLIPHLEVAKSFRARGKGLLGRASLAAESGMWIHRCNSIHTFFMKFPIDCIFVDRNLKVKAIYPDVQPWRLLLPIFGASSVIELASGTTSRLSIQVGDQLHVGT